MRFWISRQPGEVEGPFDIDTIKRMQETGDLPDSTQLCPEGTELWHPLSQLETLAAEAPPTTVGAADAVVAEQGGSALHEKHYTVENAFAIGWSTLQKHYTLLLAMAATVFCMQLIISGFGVVSEILFGPTNLFAPPGGGGGGDGGGGVVNFYVRFASPSNLIDTLLGFFVVTPYALGAIITVVRVLRGEAVSWSDSWCGFRRGNYGRLLLIQLCWYGLFLLLMVAMGVLFGLPALLTSQMGGATSATPVLLAIGAVCTALIWFSFYVRLGYSTTLVIDPKAGRPSMREAFRGSWRMTRGLATFGSLVALGFLVSMIILFSVLMCVLPALFLGIPYATAVVSSAYALLFQDDRGHAT
ncbi:MAG: hypothetical protein VX641_00875 [Planctomycetota bacterium]|nr:hypothetical protein [Planctomycetota bacterium]